MSLCDESCRPCIHSTTMSNAGVACVYILNTGTRRGCPAGEGCSKRKTGQKPLQIDVMLFFGRTEPTSRTKVVKDELSEKERVKQYNHEYYEKHKEELKVKAKVAHERRKSERKADTKTWAEKKKITEDRTRAICQGRQRAAIEQYLAETGLTCTQLANLAGVSSSTMRKWRREGNQADWTKLAQLGIKRPEGL